MKIALCDDNLEERDFLYSQLNAAMEKMGMAADIVVFDTADEMLKAAEKAFYSIFFLDILLPGISGMDAALKLRRQGNYSPVIFTTTTKDYLLQSYSVWAADYLVKPISEKAIEDALVHAFATLKGSDRQLEIIVARHAEFIPYADIYYIEGNNRNCIIHTRTGTYTPYNSINGMLEALNDKRFLCCHRSYLINLDHVLTVQRDKAAMRDDTMVPIRRGGTNAVRQAWEDRRFDRVSERV